MKTNMKKMNRRKLATVALSCAFALAIGSISVYAAWNYLKPNQVINELSQNLDFGDELEDLEAAFTEENAIYINETQTCGGYTVSLLGITSGDKLVKYKLTADGVELTDRSYILLALEHDTLDLSTEFNNNIPFQVFPIVTGYDFEMNRSLFGSGCAFQYQKGDVLYYLYECDNLEKFADHDIYMCVSDDLPEFSEYSYSYDQSSGTIAKNEEYEGLNALFSLPLDSSKADPQAAAAAVAEVEQRRQKLKEKEEQAKKLPLTKSEQIMEEAFAFVDQITPENINDYATPLTEDGAVQTFGPMDAQGRIRFHDSYDNSFWIGVVNDIFPDGKTDYITSTGISNNDISTLVVKYYKLNEDGTVTLQYYKPNLPE